MFVLRWMGFEERCIVSTERVLDMKSAIVKTFYFQVMILIKWMRVVSFIPSCFKSISLI